MSRETCPQKEQRESSHAYPAVSQHKKQEHLSKIREIRKERLQITAIAMPSLQKDRDMCDFQIGCDVQGALEKCIFIKTYKPRSRELVLIDKHSCQGKVQEAWRHLFLIGRSSKVQGCAEDYERLKRDKICHIYYPFTSKHSFMTVLQMFSATNEGGGEGEREYWFQVMW